MEKLSQQDIEGAYQRYFPMIREKCARMLRNREEARDVAQETFIRLWEKRDTIENPKAVSSWLYRTSTRLAVERYRRGKRQEDLGEDDYKLPPSGMAWSPEDAVHTRDVLAHVATKLPKEELEVAVLSRLDGLNQEEIGEVLQLSDRTVRRILTRLDERLARWRERGVR